MLRISFFVVLYCLCCQFVASQECNKPNIDLILVDDLNDYPQGFCI